MANEAIRAYDGDAQYLRNEPREALVCPVCNAEHSESFMDLLTYADDARSLREITARLEKDGREIAAKLQQTVAQIGALEGQYRRISHLLDTRRGDLQFRQVVESLGAQQAFQAFEEERSILEGQLSRKESARAAPAMPVARVPAARAVIRNVLRIYFLRTIDAGEGGDRGAGHDKACEPAA